MSKSRKKQFRNLFLIVFLFPIVFLFMSFVSGLTPVSSREEDWYSYEVVYISLGINTILWLMLIALIILRDIYNRKIWVLEFLTGIMIFPAAFGVLALNFIRPSLPNWWWLIVLVAMYPVVAVMPFVNQSISKFLHKELFAPKTRLGKALLWGLPAMGITGATLSQMAQNFGNGLIGFAIIGLIFHLLLVWQTASFAQQIWEQWQREKEKKKELENA